MDWYDRGFIVKIGDNYCLKADDVAKQEDPDTIFITDNDWSVARCPRCGKEVDYDEIDSSEIVTRPNDFPNGDRFRITCLDCGDVYDLWVDDPKPKRKMRKEGG